MLKVPQGKKIITTGSVVGIFISAQANHIMESVTEIEAIEGRGLKHDRYGEGIGSFNRKRGGVGHRQVSFMNARFFTGTPFEYKDSYRNVITDGVELLWLIGEPGVPRKFQIGTAVFEAVKYLDPCNVPSVRTGKPGFKEMFSDCGAIIASVIKSGRFKVDDPVFHENKAY